MFTEELCAWAASLSSRKIAIFFYRTLRCDRVNELLPYGRHFPERLDHQLHAVSNLAQCVDNVVCLGKGGLLFFPLLLVYDLVSFCIWFYTQWFCVFCNSSGGWGEGGELSFPLVLVCELMSGFILF